MTHPGPRATTHIVPPVKEKDCRVPRLCVRPSANHLMLAESWEFAPTSRIHPLAEHSQSGPGVCRDASALYMMQCLHAEILQTIDRIDDQPTSQLRFNARINGCCVCGEVFSNCAACSSHCAMSSLKHYITNCTACSPIA